MITFHLVAAHYSLLLLLLLLPLLLLGTTITIIIMIILHYFILFHYYYWYYYYVDHLYHHYHHRWSWSPFPLSLSPLSSISAFINYVVIDVINILIRRWKRLSAVTATMTFQYRETNWITFALHRSKKEMTYQCWENLFVPTTLFLKHGDAF